MRVEGYEMQRRTRVRGRAKVTARVAMKMRMMGATTRRGRYGRSGATVFELTCMRAEGEVRLTKTHSSSRRMTCNSYRTRQTVD